MLVAQLVKAGDKLFFIFLNKKNTSIEKMIEIVLLINYYASSLFKKSHCAVHYVFLLCFVLIGN